MEISVSDAKAQLTDLIKQAEGGEDIVLTRHGRPVVRLVPIKRKLSPEKRYAILKKISEDGAKKASPGPCAARSQDFLYDEFGFPK